MVLVRVIVCGAIAASVVSPLRAEPLPTDCQLEPGPTHSVARVADGETLVLDDGRFLRLAGIASPRAGDIAATRWPIETQARDALDGLVGARSVVLHFAGRRIDRHDRVLAQAVVIVDEERLWVQGRLVALGLARAAPLAEVDTCLATLVAIEQRARSAGLGVWREAAYRIRDARRPAELRRHQTSFQLVEGRIAAVAETRNHIHLNFGADWRDDFTISVARKSREFLGQRGRGKDLVGRAVRVRGWIESLNGPAIELTAAGQLEWLDNLTITRPRRPWRRSVTR